MNRVVELPRRGRLIVATDLQGNLEDFVAVKHYFESRRAQDPETHLVITGDLVHGPEIAREHWPLHLGEFYFGDSPSVIEGAMALEREHAGHVTFLLGNHEHAHVGGPVVSKFFPNEAARLEGLLGSDRTAEFRAWIRTWPWVALAPAARICLTHAAPHVAIRSAEDISRMDLVVPDDDDLDLDTGASILAFLWARSTSTERAHAFLRALSSNASVAIYGHDIAQGGFAIDREPLLCISTSFGCWNGDKLLLDWDLSEPAESAAHVASKGLVPLYPNAPPVLR